MISRISLYLCCVKAAFALQIPRQATTSYTNTSAAVSSLVSTTPGPFCCEVYAPGVGLHHWYTGADPKVLDQILVTEFLRYNNTIVPTATITTFPSDRLYQEAYLADVDGPAPIPGLPTDLNGPYYGGAYDATYVENAADTVFRDNTTTSTIASAPYMAFGDFYMFVGHVNSAGTCMGTNRYDPRQTYMISSVAQDWFSTASAFPFLPNSPIFTNGINFTNFYANYESQVSSQTSTWDQRVVVTEINDDLFAWLTKQPAVLSSVPHIVSCSPVSAAGAPNLHVRVTFLTTSSAVTSTTNAIYSNTATTTSAAPASKTPVVVTSTKAPTIDLPAPTTAESPSGGSSNQPTQSTANQGAGTSPVLSSDQSDNQPTQSTTNQVGDVSSGKPAPASTESVPFNSPPTQVTATGDATASLGSPSNKAPENPTQQPATNQGSDNSPAAPSDNSGSQPTQSTANGAGASSTVLSQGGTPDPNAGIEVIQTSEPVVVVIGGVTATALSPSSISTESNIPDTGGHVVVVSEDTHFTQAPGATEASRNQVISDGQTVQVSTAAIPTAPAEPVADSSFEPVSSGAYAIAGQTLNPGGSAIEISGTTYSLQTPGGGVVINGETVPLSTLAPQTPVPPAPVVIGEVTATPVASDQYVVADQTLSRGGSAIEISGTTYSLPPSGSNALVKGQITPISTIQISPQPPATVVIGGVTAKPESSGAYYLVADQTLSPGGSALEISGVTYSLPTSGANIVIDGANSVIIPTNVHTISAVAFGSATAVPLLAGGYVLGSQFINPGGSAIEISGTIYSLPASGNSVVVDGKTTAIQAISANDGAITLGSQVYTAVAASATPLVVASQTLLPGGNAITVSGTVFSLPPDATDSIVVNGQTTALAAAASESVELSIGSQRLSLTPLSSGIVIASQTLYPGGPAITVQGETLSIASDGTAAVIQSGTTTSTEGLGGYIWQGIATSTSNPSSASASGLASSIAMSSKASSGITSTQAAASKETGSASSAQTSTSDASSNQPASTYQSATIALVICLFAIVLL